MLIATSRKLFFASYKNGKWNSTVKSIKDISQIAIARGVFIGLINKRYLRLIFKDQTEVGVWLDAKTKESSNPDMFLKRFLACLDDSILGQANDGITNRRRRTIQPQSQSSNSTPNQSQISRMETESVEQQIGRKLDLTNLASDIHSGDTYQSERFIEL